MSYTPSSTFVFTSSSYTPSSAFVFEAIGDDPVAQDPPFADPNLALSRTYTLSVGSQRQYNCCYSLLASPNQEQSKSLNLVWSLYRAKDAHKRIAMQRFIDINASLRISLSTFNHQDTEKQLVIHSLNEEDHKSRLVWGQLLATDNASRIKIARLTSVDASVFALFSSQLSANDASKILAINAFSHQDIDKKIIWGQRERERHCSRRYRPPEGDALAFNFVDEYPSLDFEFKHTDNTLFCTIDDPSGYRDYPSHFPIYQPSRNDVQKVYFIMHTISVVVLPSRLEIDVLDINMSIDIDSYSWQMQMNIGKGIELIRPDESGVKEVEINIDGYVFAFIIESYTENSQFSKTTWSVTGRSKIALLTAPYKLPVSVTYTDAILASQIVDNELLLSGFSVAYNTVDWLVDADAFSYQNLTSLQAIKRVADAVGGVILPHRHENSLAISPRYQHSPWNWMTAPARATLTHDLFTSISGVWQPAADINAVYVTGNTAGIQCLVKRAGTAGDKLAAQVVDNLITHADAGRERGRNIISDRGKQEVFKIKLPVLPVGETPEIYECGDLLEISEQTVWRGMVIGINIAITQATNDVPITAYQTISIERHYGNS